MQTERELRELLVEFGRRLWDRGLIGACEGNISIRVDANRLLCTPAGASKGHLEPDGLVMAGIKQRWFAGGEPTSEVALHVACYAARDDIGAVIHAHPAIATGFSLAGETIPTGVLNEADLVLGEVALVPYAVPASDDVPRKIKPFLHNHNVFLLAHHGAVAFGTGLHEAYNRMETLERCAQIILTARTLGRVNSIPSANAAELLGVSEAASGG